MPAIDIGLFGVAGSKNDITDVSGLLVGHYQRVRDGWLTGTTVVVPPPHTVGGVDVRGGGPSTRETDALSPTTLTNEVHAICLSGGSSYGLGAADGVLKALGALGVGFRVGPEDHMVVPIVPTACLFDIVGRGEFTNRPDASFGEAAFVAANAGPVAQGNVGAGTGAHAGKLKGGIGSASVILPNGVTVGALVALNSGGNIVDPLTGELYGARYRLDHEFDVLRTPSPREVSAARAILSPVSPRNTVLVVVATDAALNKSECTRVAMAAHDGLARGITPVHCMTDGDVVFSLATGTGPPLTQTDSDGFGTDMNRILQFDHVLAASANVVTRALVHAALAATGEGGVPSYFDVFPSARAT